MDRPIRIGATNRSDNPRALQRLLTQDLIVFTDPTDQPGRYFGDASTLVIPETGAVSVRLGGVAVVGGRDLETVADAVLALPDPRVVVVTVEPVDRELAHERLGNRCRCVSPEPADGGVVTVQVDNDRARTTHTERWPAHHTAAPPAAPATPPAAPAPDPAGKTTSRKSAKAKATPPG